MPDPLDRLTTALAGRYRIERELGAGGMATVYLAEDIKHHRLVAIKVLRAEFSAAISAERFLHEIRVTASLQHPHILPLFDSGEAEGVLFYVMPYVAEASLRDRIAREGRLPLEDALAIAGDVASALTFAHAHGIIHRDIKPENILLEDGEALVADFGIALARAMADDARLTETGLSLGTPTYMSPEQIMGERTIDGRSDVYALGCVLFEMLTGAPPFTGPTAQAIIGQGLTTRAPSVRSRRPDLSPGLDAVLSRALAKEPAERFATPRDMMEACRIATLPRVRARWVAGVSLAAVALLSIVAFPLWRRAQADRARNLLPAIGQFAQDGDYAQAYDLALRAEKRLAGDSALGALLDEVSDVLSVTTEPAGATVHVQRISAEGDSASVADSVLLGTTPIDDVRVSRGDYRVVVRKAGYATMERIASSAFERVEQGEEGGHVALALQMQLTDSIPPDMVAVPGGRYTIVSPDLPRDLSADLQPFFVDRFEVSNDAYGEFVRSAGYASPEWWRAASAAGFSPRSFLDRTALPAPRPWLNQSPLPGMGRHPVSGVSWYEAAAYCAAAGKRLPSLYEWEKSARDGITSRFGVIMPWGFQSAVARTDRRANFAGSSTLPVDALPFGISPYGAYGLAGNVKEWLGTPVVEGNAVAGGSWQDPAYLFSEVEGVAPASASAAIGFRCVKTRGAPGADAPRNAAMIPLHPPPPAYHPVDPATFRTLLSFYRYDRRPANPRGLTTEETADWRRERLWIDGVGRDSILLYLYRPKRAAPPFQTLVNITSASTFFFDPVWKATEHDLGPLMRSGRAVLAVVFKGMLERPFPPGYEVPSHETVGFRDLMVLHATEMRLGMDYLATRTEIDTGALAYLGLSFGAGSRLLFAALDDRFKAVVFLGGGIDERMLPTLPEAANFNFAPYIRPPKLMLNGRNDEEHPWLSRAKPLWDLLREPKELVLLDGAGHHPPLEERVPPITAFLDRTLGPVATIASPTPAKRP